MKPAATIKASLRKEMFEAIESKGFLSDYIKGFVEGVQNKMEALGPPPPGYRYEVCEPRFDFNPEEGKYTVTSYIKTVPIE